jgi:hypothetical protein
MRLCADDPSLIEYCDSRFTRSYGIEVAWTVEAGYRDTLPLLDGWASELAEVQVDRSRAATRIEATALDGLILGTRALISALIQGFNPHALDRRWLSKHEPPAINMEFTGASAQVPPIGRNADVREARCVSTFAQKGTGLESEARDESVAVEGTHTGARILDRVKDPAGPSFSVQFDGANAGCMGGSVWHTDLRSGRLGVFGTRGKANHLLSFCAAQSGRCLVDVWEAPGGLPLALAHVDVH